MPEELFDGTLIQGGIDPDISPPDVSDTHQTGVVLARYPLDHEKNRLGEGSEYEVLLASGQTLRCRSSFSRTGHVNGWDVPLNETTATIDGTPLNFRVTPMAKMNGDHVLIAFPYDDTGQAMIVRRLPHPATNMEEETLADAPSIDRLFLTHQGIRIYIKGDGSLTVDATQSDASKVTVLSTGGSVTLNGDQMDLKVVEAGKVSLEVGAAVSVLDLNSTAIASFTPSFTVNAKGDASIEAGDPMNPLNDIARLEMAAGQAKTSVGTRTSLDLTSAAATLLTSSVSVRAETDVAIEAGDPTQGLSAVALLEMDGGVSAFRNKAQPDLALQFLVQKTAMDVLVGFFIAQAGLLSTLALAPTTPVSVAAYATALSNILPTSVANFVTTALKSG